MENQLEKQIKQIAETIKYMEDGDFEVDMQSLLELDDLLDLLNTKIKSTKLGNPLINQSKEMESTRYEGMLIFDTHFKVYKYTGAIDYLLSSGVDTSFSVQEKLKMEDGSVFEKEVQKLINNHKSRTFDMNIHSIQGVPLSARFHLELLSSTKGDELILAGINFNNTTVADIQSYQQIVIENLPDIDVYLFDTNCRYVLAGGREKERFGLTNNFFAGKSLFEAFDSKVSKRLFPFYRKALSGEMADGEIRIDDQIYYIWATPVKNFYDEVVGGTAILQNVTKDKEIEFHLKKARDDAQKADQAKSVFLANMSHEIRTPLNAIIGFTEQLSKTDFNEEQQKYVDLIDESSEHLLYLVNEILILFKLGMGKVYIDKAPFSLKHVLNVLFDSFIIKANERKLNLSVHVDSEVPDSLVGDPYRLKQVLINLLSNAIRYTDYGDVDLRCKLLEKNKKSVRIRFEVKDTGHGIPDDVLPIIFDEFTQSKMQVKNHRKGAGLGLAITKKLVELLDGSISVESIVGQGSSFCVDMEFAKAKKKQVVDNDSIYSLRENLLEGKRVMFADDDDHNVLLAETMLKNWNTNYKLAKDGKEALELLKKEEFDIALIDIHMPKLSGNEVAEKIRAMDESPNQRTKMVAVTANILASDLKLYRDQGFDEHLLKPFKEAELYNKVCNVLKIPIDIKVTSPLEEITEDKVYSTDKFSTDNLKETANGDVAFFNKMITTFIKNTSEVTDGMKQALKVENWKEVGEKAHRAIPSFKYFGLNDAVKTLSELENFALRDQNFSPIPGKTNEVLKEIDHILEQAKKSIIQE